jgi:hypothetical protein
MEYISAFLWFLSGVLFNKALSFVFDFGVLASMVHKVTSDLLISLVLIEQDIQFMIQSRKALLKSRGISEDKIEELSSFYDKSFLLWRERVIITLLNNYPQAFRSYLPVYNWESAVKYVNATLKAHKVLADKNK